MAWMDDAEYVLMKDTQEKKATARSASKKVGSTKKCTMPYEMLSSKERKKYMAASEVTTFKLETMTLRQFRNLTADKQLELLKWYGERFGWTAAGVSFALDCDYTTGKRLLEEFMLTPMFAARWKAATSDQKAKFRENRNNATAERYGAKTEAVIASTQGDTLTLPEPEKETQGEKKPLKHQFNVSLQTECDGRDLARYLSGVGHSLSTGRKYAVRLFVSELPESEEGEGDVVYA